MGDGDWVLPALDLSCRRCGAVVDKCSLCGAAFCEHTRVMCRRELGHFHDACVEQERDRSSRY